MIHKIGGVWFDPSLVAAVLPPNEALAPGGGKVPVIGKSVAILPTVGLTVSLDTDPDTAGKQVGEAMRLDREAERALALDIAHAQGGGIAGAIRGGLGSPMQGAAPKGGAA